MSTFPAYLVFRYFGTELLHGGSKKADAIEALTPTHHDNQHKRATLVGRDRQHE
jgi:hypothetical protein